MQGELFEPANATHGPTGNDGRQHTDGAAYARGRTVRVVNSALWASWADALGFISELTTSQGLKRRLKGRPLSAPVEWTRRVGGRGGPDVVLPAGTYSDDTQLRLATGRCISGRGFDVEAFAHVELPGWLAYALGGGVGTKAAAARMMKPAAVWYAGQHDGWTRGGGNGAAMRIQPHVWSSPVVAGPGPWLAGLLADSCSTHAHPRALLGAAFHAYALSIAVSTGRLPNTSAWIDLLEAASHDGLNELRRHPEISDYWIGAYDKAAHTEGLPTFADAWETTTQEMRSQVQLAVALCTDAQSNDGFDWYASLTADLGLRDKATRGAGSTTVIAALALAHVHHESPGLASLRAATEIDTDTDTIATMAAALAGATTTTPPASVGGREDFSDRNYIVSEAERLARLATHETNDSAPALRYPDLLTWSLPKAQVDLVGTDGEQLWLAGLTALKPVDREPARRGEFVWQWFETDWHQHVLAKTRIKPKQMPVALMPAQADAGREDESDRRPATSGGTPRDSDVRASSYPGNLETRVTVASAISFLRRHDFAHDRVGYAIAQMARTATDEEFDDFARALRHAFLQQD